jgi:hypothetical protein
MPRIKIDNNSKVYYGNKFYQISFSLVSAPKHGWKQIREFATCRDYINDCMIAAVNAHHYNEGKGQGYWVKGTNPPLDFNYLRLLIAKDPPIGKSKEVDKRRIFKAKQIINMYEELAGFKRKSTIKQVDHSSGKVPNCWLLTGPSQWMKASQLVSMVTLIFRVVVTHGGFQECNNLDQVEERFKELCVKGAKRGGYYSPGAGDIKQLLPPSWPKFRTIMTKYDDLFGNKPKDFWFPKAGVGSWHGPGGIYSLCTNNLLFKELKDAAKSVLG